MAEKQNCLKDDSFVTKTFKILPEEFFVFKYTAWKLANERTVKMI